MPRGGLNRAGALVERRSLISDDARSMGDAMAGVRDSGRTAYAWGEDEEERPLRRVCIRRLRSPVRSLQGRELEDAADRSSASSCRAAPMDELLKRSSPGDSDALEAVRNRHRAWVIAGQRQDVSRIGGRGSTASFRCRTPSPSCRVIESGLAMASSRRRLRRRRHKTPTSRVEALQLVRSEGSRAAPPRSGYWNDRRVRKLGETPSVQICAPSGR